MLDYSLKTFSPFLGENAEKSTSATMSFFCYLDNSKSSGFPAPLTGQNLSTQALGRRLPHSFVDEATDLRNNIDLYNNLDLHDK